MARAHLATKDFIFSDELGPAGQLTTGLNKFAPGSKLVVREADGQLRVLIDTGAANPPLGLRDVQSPDVSFDGKRIVFVNGTGPTMYKDRSYARPFYSWRLYEIGVNGTGLRQLTRSDRAISIRAWPRRTPTPTRSSMATTMTCSRPTWPMGGSSLAPRATPAAPTTTSGRPLTCM